MSITRPRTSQSMGIRRLSRLLRSCSVDDGSSREERIFYFIEGLFIMRLARYGVWHLTDSQHNNYHATYQLLCREHT